LPPNEEPNEDRLVELERVAERHDELRIEVGREPVLLLPPLLVEGRIGLSVPGQVVGDHAVAARDVLVLEQAAPLVVVAAGGVLADERPAGAVLEEEDLVLASLHVDRHVMAGDR
jgi:hypothetical protein